MIYSFFDYIEGRHTMSQYYTSGEFAKKAHVSIRTIRYYDQKNLLKPATHAKGCLLYTSDAAGYIQIEILPSCNRFYY